MPHAHIAGAFGRTATLATAGLLFVALTASVLGTAGPALAHAVAQNPPPPADAAPAEKLTAGLAALAAKYNAASTVGQRAQLERDLLAAASIREQELAALVESDPASVLRVAVSDRVRAALPATVQAHVEEQIDIEGDLEILHEDNATGGRYHYHLSTASHGRLTLHFAADAPDVSTGTHIRARGVRVQQTLALDSGASVQALVTVAPNTLGEQPTLVILVNFTDKVTQPYTVSQARDVVFNTTSGWDMENSYGQTWLTGDVVGWYTIPQSSTVCDYTQLATYAKQAATAAGIPVSNYRRLLYGFPSNACTWWGLGTVGGNPSQAWIKGTFLARGGRPRDGAQLRALPLPLHGLRRLRVLHDLHRVRVRRHDGHHGRRIVRAHQRVPERAPRVARVRRLAAIDHRDGERHLHADTLRAARYRPQGPQDPSGCRFHHGTANLLLRRVSAAHRLRRLPVDQRECP
jgi:hypothetical protein